MESTKDNSNRHFESSYARDVIQESKPLQINGQKKWNFQLNTSMEFLHWQACLMKQKYTQPQK